MKGLLKGFKSLKWSKMHRMSSMNENNYNFSRIWLNLLKQFIKIENCFMLKKHNLEAHYKI